VQGKTVGLEELDTRTSSRYHYDAEAKKLYLKIVSTDEAWEELEVQPAP